MKIRPTELKRQQPGSLFIRWSDGLEQSLPLRILRDHCPCAACLQKQQTPEKQGELKVLSPAETMPLEILAMQPAGNYAYNIQFSDGHSSGIFTFDLLRQLSDQ